MFRYILNIVIIVSTLNSCVGQQTALKKSKNSSVIMSSGNFRVTKIDSTASYYLIYGLKNQALYKIISKKEIYQSGLKEIQLNKTYFFNIEDFLQRDNKNPLTGFSSSDPCFFLDDKSVICRENNVLGPYKTENLKGLFYIK